MTETIQKKKLRHLPISDIYINDGLRISKRKFSRDGFIGFGEEEYEGIMKKVKDNVIIIKSGDTETTITKK